MATTIPFPFREHHDFVVYSPAHNDLVDELIKRYESNLADSDKADDDYNQGYYEGQVDATAWALLELLGIPEEQWNAYVERKPNT